MLTLRVLKAVSGRVSDERHVMWGAAIGALTQVGRGHTEEMRLAADPSGKVAVAAVISID